MTSMLEDPKQLITDAKAKLAVEQLHKVTSTLRKVVESKQICRKRNMYGIFQIYSMHAPACFLFWVVLALSLSKWGFL